MNDNHRSTSTGILINLVTTVDTPCMMFDDMPVERQNTMSNYVTKTIKTILTEAEVHMLVDGLSYLDGEESANLARGLENSLLKESSYISSPCREKTSWKDAFR